MATKYISPTGSNGAAGTSGAPWQTLAYAVTNTSAGDTIVCAAGTYTFTTQTFSSSRTITGPAVSSGLPTAIFNGAASSFSSRAVWEVTSSATLTLNNLRFTNFVLGASGFGIGGYSGQTGTQVLANCCFDTISFSGNNGGILGGLNATQTITLSGCLFFNNLRTGSYTSCVLFYLYSSGAGETFIANNVSVYQASSTYPVGLFYHNGTNTVTVKNLIAQTVSAVAFTANSTPTWDYSYSCANNFTSVPSGSNNITSDPLFVDPSNSNFNLRPTSPCLDTGIIV